MFVEGSIHVCVSLLVQVPLVGDAAGHTLQSVLSSWKELKV